MQILGTGSKVEAVFKTVFSDSDIKDFESLELSDIMDMAVEFGSMEDYDAYTIEIYGSH